MKILLFLCFFLQQIQLNKLKSKIQKYKKEIIDVDEDTGLVNLTPPTPKVSARGWLRLSSAFFQDQEKYPIINIQKDKTFEKLAVDIVFSHPEDKRLVNMSMPYNGTFRKNSHFQEGVLIPPTIDSFFFRLSERNLFYTETEIDLYVLGAFQLSHLKIVEELGPDCFRLVGQEIGEDWTLCISEPEDKKDVFFCELLKFVGKKCDQDEQTHIQKQITKVQNTIQPLIIMPIPSPDCETEWNYNKHGQDWQCHCNEGFEQSPIDLPDYSCSEPIYSNAEFEYRFVQKENLKVEYQTNLLRILPINGAELGKMTDTDDTVYEVSEIIIHTPSEHTKMQRRFAMEVQIVHRAIKGVMRQKAVLSILYDIWPGETYPAFERMDLINLPNQIMTESKNLILDNFHIMQFMVKSDFEQTPNFSYYKYIGSLTTPPCEEYTIWFVISEPLKLGSTVIEMLRSVQDIPENFKQQGPKNQIYDNQEGSYREIQKINKRMVQYYDHTQSLFQDTSVQFQKPQQQKPEGHYEKIQKTVPQYFFVGGDKPSGIPGSNVVTKEETLGKDLLGRQFDRFNLEFKD